MFVVIAKHESQYNKPRPKWPLIKDQNLVFKTIYPSKQVKKYCRMLQGEHTAGSNAFCNTFDLN